MMYSTLMQSTANFDKFLPVSPSYEMLIGFGFDIKIQYM